MLSSHSLSLLLFETIDIISKTFAHYGILLDHSIEEDMLVSGHQSEFRQVLINILTNSQEAIIRNDKDRKVYISLASKNNNDIILSIQDSGGGISDDVAQKIFDPYFSTKFESQSTGIGLYMSKMIIENTMNGTINISNKNGGLLVDIILPRVHENVNY